jgi:hypothetical protein
MQTIQQSYTPASALTGHKINIIARFFAWSRSQEKNRIGWSAVTIAVHGCVITPLTLLFIMLAGNNMIFWPFAIGAMTMSLVVNLAALPARIIIPVFFLSILIDLIVMINCIAILFNT